jgi:hypothetical protein
MRSLLTIAFVVTIVSCHAQTSSYKSAGTQVKYPSGWTLDTSGTMNSKWIVFSPLANDSDKFRENVNLIIQNLQAHDLNLDQYTQISESQIKQLFTDGKLIESTKQKNSNGDYQKVIFTATQGIFSLKFEQYYFIKNGNAYVLTFTTQADAFDAYRVAGEQVLNSFTL